MKDKKILICILDVLMFAALLFMGADTLSAEYKDISIRYVQIIFPICFILLGYLRAYNFKHMKYFMPFIVIFFISTIFAINFWDGFLYFLWLIYNIAFITFVVASYIKFSGLEKFLKLFRW